MYEITAIKVSEMSQEESAYKILKSTRNEVMIKGSLGKVRETMTI